MNGRYENRLPLIAHVIQRLAIGGLENGMVNLINHMGHDRYRHAIVCLKDSTDYSQRIQRSDIQIIELQQRYGKDLCVHARFLKAIRTLKPAIVHTRNLSSLEFQMIAALAGVRGRVHGEHGRDMYDLDGTNFKYNVLRKLMRIFVHRYVAVSRNLAEWLVNTVNVPRERVTQIYNGVDATRFCPGMSSGSGIGPTNFCSSDSFVVGTVGRMEVVKDQLTLVRAFLYMLRENQDLRRRLRLVVVGDGVLRSEALQILREAQAEQIAWLPGERDDIPEIMRGMDLFVLPSLREGISNTVLEAMATSLPVVATNVGGNSELVAQGVTGTLVPYSNPVAMARAIRNYLDDPAKGRAHGNAGRQRVLKFFSMDAMVKGYLHTYDAVLKRRPMSSRFAFSQTHRIS